MKQTLAVLNSNQINRYNMMFSVGALESALTQSWDLGVPTFIGHDHHMLCAWTKGLSLYIEPRLVRLTGIIFHPETEEDGMELSNALNVYTNRLIESKVLPYFDKMKDLLKQYLSGNEKPIFSDCAAIYDEGLVKRVFPTLFEQQDDDGLIPLSNLKMRAPGVYEKDDFLLFAHQYFRRSLSRWNSLNSPFFNVLNELHEDPKLNIRIALDPNMIGLSSTFKFPSVELEYWWGPKFTEDLGMIELGVTKHTSSKNDVLFHGVSGTEFWWYSQDNRKTFECEELRDIASLGISRDMYGCRFIHSILESKDSLPIHIDGAIRMYTEEGMIQRLGVDIKSAGRHTIYTKLWRIDGQLEVPQWKDLVTHYFKDNHLVGEYLGGKEEPDRRNPHSVQPAINTIPLVNYIPSSMKPGQGLKMSISYQSKENIGNGDRTIISYDHLYCNNDDYRYIEGDTIEIIKLLRRMGEQIELSKDRVLIGFNDRVLNLPLILHNGSQSVILAEKTREALSQLCKAWTTRKDDRIISCNIGIQYQEKNIYFSFAGHVTDLSKWLSCNVSKFPLNDSDMDKWCEATAEYLQENYPNDYENPSLEDILHKTGLLVFERRFLKPDEYVSSYDEDYGIIIHLKIPKDNYDLQEKLAKGQLETALAFHYGEPECSKCKNLYEQCNCSKYIDKDVRMIMKNFSFIAPFWTDKKA
jgi:hypothetical protein